MVMHCHQLLHLVLVATLCSTLSIITLSPGLRFTKMSLSVFERGHNTNSGLATMRYHGHSVHIFHVIYFSKFSLPLISPWLILVHVIHHTDWANDKLVHGLTFYTYICKEDSTYIDNMYKLLWHLYCSGIFIWCITRI